MGAAEKLIQKTKQNKERKIPANVVREIKVILAHNDSLGGPNSPGHVGISQVCSMMAEMGYVCGRDALRGICRSLGRRSFNER